MEGKIYYKDYFKEHGITAEMLGNCDLRRETKLWIHNVLFNHVPYIECLEDVCFTDCVFENVGFHGELNCVSFGNCKFKDAAIRISELSSVYFMECAGNLEIDRCIINESSINSCEATFKLRHCFGEGTVICDSPNVKCPLSCPSEGSFIAYKKCFRKNDPDDYIVKLLIPEDAKRSSSIGIKCRASKAVVLDIISLSDKKKKVDTVYSASCLTIGEKFPYKIGETVYPHDFDENRFEECSSGIHFFMNFEDAAEYCF